jgi:hypothetical protein
MAFSFDPTLSRDLDWIRADLGDTDADTALFADEQIVAVLTAEGDRTIATYRLAAQAIALLTREPVRMTAAGEMHDYTDRLAALQPLATRWYQHRDRLDAMQREQASRPSMTVRGEAVW